MKGNGKKRTGWKIAFFVLLALVVIFIVWLILPDNEDKNAAKHGASAHVNTKDLTIEDVVRSSKASIIGNGKDKVTVMLYMNGSDLESDDGEATEDLQEMIKAGSSSNVNFLVQTMGTKKWQKTLGIASDRSQIYELSGKGLKLVKDNLGQLDCTISSTLENFITFGVTNYPADRYILLFWDHGGGPVYGYGYDQFQGEYDALTIDEMQTALNNAGVYFDFIGMDCCLMSSMEVCCALFDYCDYCVLAEDFESGYGWEYTTWLKRLYQNTSISTEELGKTIVDSMITANKNGGEEGILAVIDQNYMKVLYSAWVDFAYANESDLLDNNYSRHRQRSHGGRVLPSLKDKGFFSDWYYGDSDEDYSISDYYITDIMSLAQNVDSAESDALASALAQTLVYVGATSGDSNLTGISVTLPYGDSEFYSELKTVFTNCGFDKEYISWLGKFVDSSGSDVYYDYDIWDDEWSGWDDYEDDYDWSDWDYYYDDYDYGWCDEEYYYDDYYYDDYYYDDYYYDDHYHHNSFWDWFFW